MSTLNAADIVLVVTTVVAFIAMIVGAVYFVVYFQHPEDRNVAWFPKIVVILSIVVACANVLLMPLDVATQAGQINAQGLFPMRELEYAFYLMSIVLFFSILPFAYFYYEGLSEDDSKQTWRYQACYAFAWVTPLIIIAAIIIIVCYWFFGYVDLPLTVLSAPLVDFTTDVSNPAYCALGPGGDPLCTSFTRSISIRVSPIVYIIAIVNLFGWVALVFFGGVGLIAVPLDYIQGFIHRPRPIRLTEYTKLKHIVGQRARKMLSEGKEIKKLKEDAEQSKKRKLIRKAEARAKEYQAQVYLLESDYKLVEESYQNQGGNIIWQWFRLFLGIISISLSIMWLLQFILAQVPVSLGQPAIIPLLSSMFQALDKAPFAGPAAYGIFAFYLLLCVLKGSVKLGVRFVFFTLYTLELHNTLMNSLLFNTWLFLTGSLAVVQMCAVAFADYVRFTAVSATFTVQINNMRGLNYIYTIYIFAMLGVIVLAALYFSCRPYDNNKKKDEGPITFD